jgi:hypothetical protein
MMENAKALYAGYGIDLVQKSSETMAVDGTANAHFQSLYVGECKRSAPVTQHQKELFERRSGIGSREIVVYFVRELVPSVLGCARHLEGQPAAAVAAKHAGEWTLAHLLGHLLGLDDIAFTDHDRLMNIGTFSVTNPPPDLTKDEIDKILASPLSRGRQLTAFRPEQHGFGFANRFSSFVIPAIPLLPAVGPFGGLCGGMTFAALDYFHNDEPVPTHTTGDYASSGGIPPQGSRLWELILRRHLNSVGLEDDPLGFPLSVGPLMLKLKVDKLYNSARFVLLNTATPTQLKEQLADELAKLRDTIPARPAALILVQQGSIQDSHQVVAIGYDDSVTPTQIYLYDCRYPSATCTLRVDAASGSCQLDAPGQRTESWSAFFVAQYSPVVPGYLDMQLTNGLTAASVGAIGSRVYNVQFAASNLGEAAAHATEVWPVIDPDPGPVPAQPAGVVPVGGAVSYNATISFPPALRGATVTIKAVIGNRASGRFSPLPPTPGQANPIRVTVPL